MELTRPQKIVAVRKDNETGNLTEFKTEDGTVLNYSEALTELHLGNLIGCMESTNRNGEPIIKSKRNADEEYSLSKLPTF